MQKTANKHILGLSLTSCAYFVIFLLLVSWFLFFYYGFTEGYQTAAIWLANTWNPIVDYEHGWMVPILSLYMLWHAVQHMKGTECAPSLHGIWFIIIGGLLLVLSVRALQPRIAIGAIPFLLSGATWYYWGWKAALKTAFPFFFLWAAIPLPGFQHATVGLQLLSAEMAHWGAGLFGVETVLDGTNVISADGKWDTYNIAGGCSGIRSLMALLMFSVAWGYLADKLALWKRILLALSAIPLAILGNAFRVASIFVCAEYISASFAGKTWHDWSGLLFFFPASLMGLMILHSVLVGEIPFLKKRRVITRRHGESDTEQKGETNA